MTGQLAKNCNMKVVGLFFFVFICLSSAKLAPLLSANGKNVEEIPGQYIIVYKKETPQGVFQRQLQGTKTAIGVENVGHVYNSVFKGFSSKLTGDQLLEIRKNPFVKYVLLFFHRLYCWTSLFGSLYRSIRFVRSLLSAFRLSFLTLSLNNLDRYVEIDSVVKISSPQQESCSQEPSGSWGQTRISQEVKLSFSFFIFLSSFLFYFFSTRILLWRTFWPMGTN